MACFVLLTDIEDLVLREITLALREARLCLEGKIPQGGFSCVLGVSGGTDSMVLLDAAASVSELEPDLGLGLHVCHVDHGLRAESGADADFVKTQAEIRGLPCTVYRFDGCPDDRNVEAWARDVRYQAFFECMQDTNAQLVLTAHHAADQAETLLWRLFSGRLSSSTYTIQRLDLERGICRPLLSLTRADIDAFKKVRTLPFVHDASNDDLDRTRNLLRRQVLPLLREKLNPSIDSALAQTAARLNEDEEALWDEAAALHAAARKPFGLPSDSKAAMGWRIVRLEAQNQLGSIAKKLGRTALLRAVRIAEEQADAASPLDLGFGISCGWCPTEGLQFWCGQSGAVGDDSGEAASLPVPGSIELPYADGSRVVISAEMHNVGEDSPLPSEEEMRSEFGDPLSTARVFIDAEACRQPDLSVRTWMPGDSVDVWKRGTRKVKKLFQERSLPAFLRSQLPLVVMDGSICWVPGVARSKAAPVFGETRKIIVITYVRHPPALVKRSPLI